MSDSFLQYPEADLEDARKDNVIVFSLITTITLILVSLLLTALGCIFFSFRSTNGYSVSKTKKAFKKDIKSFNLKDSIALSGTQRSLRYLAASQPEKDGNDTGIIHEQLENSSSVVDEIVRNNDEDTDDTELVSLNEINMSTKSQDNITPLSDSPPAYAFPKHLFFKLTPE